MSIGFENDNNSNDSLNRTNIYISGQFFNAYRSFEDLSASNSYSNRISEESISTGGVELGSYIKLNDKFDLGIGVSFFGGGEQWSYFDSISDSSFMYVNKYRQIAVPFRLHFHLGDELRWVTFLGVIPSSILGRRYESSYTNDEGILTENEIETFQDNLNSFQLAATVGTGVSYQLGNASVFLLGEYRYHFTNTYTGLFLNHQQKLIGGSLGMTFSF
ncbi:MAG: hypothetical protein AB8B74_07865 [Crocinitomicaceae bacterium]